jgi:response regulator RpfG family c-di-GMP phosphodiesterase
MFTLVDVWDALNNDQPYRKAWPHEKAVTYLRDHVRLFFDPDLLGRFLEMVL